MSVPLTTMLELDEGGKVVHASSFSKTVSPGIRVGYLAGPEAEIKKLAKRANETYISPNMLAESIVLELCRSGALDENIAFVKGELKARCDALVAALREQIPEAEFVVPAGGYFLWLDLAAGTDTVALLSEAKAEGVSFVAGPDFMIEGDGFFVTRGGTEQLYTRAGSFDFDGTGKLVTPDGSVLRGWMATNGTVNTNGPIEEEDIIQNLVDLAIASDPSASHARKSRSANWCQEQDHPFHDRGRIP